MMSGRQVGFTHGGNIRALAVSAGLPEDEILDFSSSVNPLGFPDWVRPLISSRVSDISRYPDPYSDELVSSSAKAYGAAPGNVVPGNGATELLYAIARIKNFTKAVIPVPAYVDYRRCADLAGVDVESFSLSEGADFSLDTQRLGACLQGEELVIIGRPNNPTGTVPDAGEIRRMAVEHPSVIFVVDESFGGFVERFDSLIKDRPANVIVVVSLTKLYAIPGLRLGLALADGAVADRIKEFMPPWSVNLFAQAVGARAVTDVEYVKRSARMVGRWRGGLVRAMRSINGLTVFDSSANFLLAKVCAGGMDARRLAGALIKDGIAIRVCDDSSGLDARYLRVAVRSEDENDRLVRAIANVMGGKAPAIIRPRSRKPAVMFQGVSSSSGKSVFTAALLRIMKQDGFDSAPFKAQNMALNSYVTLDGKEMGRAQVTQARACGLEPDVRMNPILLKPNSDTGAQVIVMGVPTGSMTTDEYFKFKAKGFETVKRAYDSLADEHEVMALEGAGSPGEVNLKHHDIVNMRMARYAGAKTFIVGDIDRGGVFASFIGVMETLAQWERNLVAGFIINKFRGDVGLLDSAIEYTKTYTGLPTVGIAPYIHDLNLPEEDQPIIRNAAGTNGDTGDIVDVAIVRLRHVSNFTDFDPLMMEPDVKVRFAGRPEELDGADIIIIPGSKNVIGDLALLAENGVMEKLKRIAMRGATAIVGICGGFQMLGDYIEDPLGIESSRGKIAGLGLASLQTTLLEEKRLARVSAVHKDSGCVVHGYEIHHGDTKFGDGTAPLVVRDDGTVAGVASGNGMVWGTYLHGIFDDDRFRRWFIDDARKRKGMAPLGKVVVRYDLDRELDRLALIIRENVDIGKIYKTIGLK